MQLLPLLAFLLPAPIAPTQTTITPQAIVTYDASVPTLEQVVGHKSGEEISSHAEVEAYLKAVAEASPRVELVEFGTSWEGRSLYYAIVGEPELLARAGDVRAGMQRIADPRGLSDADATRLIDSLPAVGWLANCVHGDEPSGTDSALRVLYHLAAAQGDDVVDLVRRECLVLIDPLQNPDGRDRFVHSTRAARGRWPDETPQSAEHSQPWPGGRVNHALFDMNRDWFAMSQPETQARVRAFLDWWPLVYVDLHEMSGNSTYYFPPPANPVHEEITPRQRAWYERYGKNNARWFDRYGFDYFTRENYDAFYPGYGDSWPTLHGSIGMTFEMASARGLTFRRKDGTLLFYADGVERHFTASMATLETLARGREEALRALLAHRREGVARGEDGDVKAYVLPPGGDDTRRARLANLLMAQGIEVHRSTGALSATATSRLDAEGDGDQQFAADTYVIPMSQPASTLAHALLHPHFDMDANFTAEQERLEARREGTEFYDLTAWSLPLLFGVEAWSLGALPEGELAPMTPGAATSNAAPLREVPPKVAYVVPWGTNGAAAMLAELLRLGVRARSIDRAFRMDGLTFPAGSFVIRIQDQPEDLHDRLAASAMAHGVDVHCADSSWVDDGPNFGTNRALDLKVPRVAMLWDRPVGRNSAGWARFVLEQRYGVPISPLRTHDLRRVDLDRFTVLIVPEGGNYDDVLGAGGVRALRGFIERGGVLVTLGNATRWATTEDVNLLNTGTESREQPDEPETKDAEVPVAFDPERAVLPDEERPPHVPGAILAVDVDPQHWLGFGYASRAHVVYDSNRVLTPLKLDAGTNVVTYAGPEDLVRAGFVWETSRKQLPHKAWLVHQRLGRGHVVAFSEDPNVRAFADGSNLFLLNAVLLTAGR
tara:strand:- start:1918 stop:4581 length:2664 start_codon:yes stop_codon:yes gene_type:complete